MTLSASGTVLGQSLANVGGSPSSMQLQTVPATGGSPLFTYQPPVALAGMLEPVLLSPDGMLVAISDHDARTGGGVTTTTRIFQNGTLSATLTGWAVGWIDNGRLLVNNYETTRGQYTGASIYGPSSLLSTPSIPELFSFQVVMPQGPAPDLLYAPLSNSIVSLSTGGTTWASGSPAGETNGFPTGAVANSQIVFLSGNLVLAEPH
jgi:hypothetical protein